MPKLIIPSAEKDAGGIAPKIIAQYRRFIDRLPDKKAGFLQFTAKEDINLGREALLEAAGKSKKYIKIRKARGQDRTLQLQRCSKAEWDKANKAPKTVKKTRTRRKPGPKPKAQQAAAAAAAEAPQTSEAPAAQE